MFIIAVFLPPINYSLGEFRQTWNLHYVSNVGVPATLFKPQYFEEKVKYDLNMERIITEFVTLKNKIYSI